MNTQENTMHPNNNNLQQPDPVDVDDDDDDYYCLDHAAASAVVDMLSSDTSPTPTPISSSSSGSALLCPTSSPAGIAKPTRRRSRASKKTPTTLLNTSPRNFRALVQQFTGCHTRPLSNTWKGPINLNFERYSQHSQNNHPHPPESAPAPTFYNSSLAPNTSAAAPGAHDHHEMLTSSSQSLQNYNSSTPLASFTDLDIDMNMEILPGSARDYYSASPPADQTWHDDDFWGH